jgi:hypothetical protein
MSSRKALIILHTVLASFFLPMGILYAVTGGLYGVGIKGGYRVADHNLTLDHPLDRDLPKLLTLTQRELASRNIDPPTGSAGIKTGGTSYFLEWTGSRLDVELHPTDDPLQAKLRIKATDPHRRFVQLHKAKGGDAFRFFAFVWMIGMVLLFITGGIMALAAKPYRQLAIISTALGLVVFGTLAIIS